MTIVEAFGEVVKATEAALQRVNPAFPALNYQYGHPKAILLVMQQWSNSTQAMQAKMYPLVALFQDFTETQPARPDLLATAPLRVIIGNMTEASYDTPQRYTHNFKPVLHPVANELVRQLKRTSYFRGTSFQYTKTDRPFWGEEGLYGSEKNIFNGAMDVVELRFTDLALNPARKCAGRFRNI